MKFCIKFSDSVHNVICMPFFLRVKILSTLMIVIIVVHAKYPNEIVDSPLVSCEQDRIIVRIRTSTANPSHIYAEDFYETQKCTVRNQNKIVFPHGECGMTTEHMENPAGTMYRICLSVQIHPLFITDSDRSYCAQCVYMEANIVDDLEQKLAISEMAPNELDPQFDEVSTPHCTYSIRKGSIDGPEVHAAVVGESVFHVWQCNNDNVGILVQNCHVEDLQGDKILIIDQNGCGVDQYLFKTPQYSADLHTAHLQSNVFKFVDKSMTRFRCQLRLCVKNRGRGCEQITPPTSCPSIDAPPDVGVRSSSSSASDSAYGNENEKQQQQKKTQTTKHIVNSINRRLFSSPFPQASQTAKPSSPSNPIGPSGGRASAPVVGPSFGRPLGNLLNSGGPPGTQVTAGPPSIRPVFSGLSTAQIVSGKTNDVEQALGSTNPPHFGASRTLNSLGQISSHLSQPNGVTKFSQSEPASRQISPSSSIGGYPYRRVLRSIKTFNEKSEGSFRHLFKREVVENSRSNLTRTISGTRSSIKENDQLDVVGIIRVVDNPSDLEFFVNENAQQLSNVYPRVTQVDQKIVPSATSLALIPLPTAIEQQLSDDIDNIDQDEPYRELEDVSLPQKCMSSSTYWTLVFGFLALFLLQFIAFVLLILNKFVLNRQNTHGAFNY